MLSNTLTKPSAGSKDQNYRSLAAIRDITSSTQLVDILITSDWPASITTHSSVSPSSPDYASLGSPPLDDVIKKVKPRYHFAGGCTHPSRFWEREPFIWKDEGDRVTRFISLGAFGGEQETGKKERVCQSFLSHCPFLCTQLQWFYAFSITPTISSHPPSNTTPNPFLDAVSLLQKRPFEAHGENFIWGNVEKPDKRPKSGKALSSLLCSSCDYDNCRATKWRER